MFGRSTRLLAAAVTIAMVGLVGGAGAGPASAQKLSNEFGTLKVGKVTGEASNGATFTGRYQIRRFVTADNGRTKALGTLTGKITQRNGEAQRVTKDRVRMVVADGTVSAAPAQQGQVGTQQEACDILNLTLGPLDLNLLGLRVQLNQVQLDITAVPGAGNLLGNLLCAVAGLLDSPQLPDLGEVLTNLLNAILGLLRA